MRAAAETAAESLLGEGELLLRERRLSEALLCFEHAERGGADADLCAGQRWLAHMLAGDFEEAWAQSDSIRRRGAPDPHRFWNGEPIQGKRVMLRCLHGFGDAVQFLRYLPLLNASASALTVEVPPRLVEIAHCFVGAGQVITWGEDAPAQEPAWDVQVEVMELPYLFRTRLGDLPIASQYLSFKSDRKPERRESLAVGVMACAGSWNPTRAIPHAMLAALFAVKGCEFWDLRSNSEKVTESDPALKQDERCGQSIAGLADTIARMDLVITVDTLAAHLAGALGQPVWILLAYDADWRWMQERDDSPWYPSARLFRQQTPGDWKDVVQRVRLALDGLVSEPGSKGTVKD